MSTRFSWPVRSSSTEAYWPVRLTFWRTVAGFADHVVAEHGGGAGVGPEQRGEDADRGGLAGAVGAQQAEDGALPDAEIHAVEGAGVTECLDQPVRFDRVGHR